MNSLIKFLLQLIFICLLSMAVQASDKQDPLGLILSWQQDPTTTMTIDWHTLANEANAEVFYKKANSESEVWTQAKGDVSNFPYSERKINRVELTGLESDTLYEFRLAGFARVRSFRTMPTSTVERAITFAIGGDVRGNVLKMNKVNRQASHFNPDFVIWGGDMSYGNSDPALVNRLYEMFDSVMHTLISSDGRTLPVIVAIGNHEVKGGYLYNNDHDLRKKLPLYQQNDASRAQIAPYFYDLHAFPGQPGYGALDFGDYLSLIILDTDHSNPVAGKQTSWLEQALKERAKMVNIMPIYHVGAFPAVRDPEADTPVNIRKHWLPLFEKAGVKVAFENHDHVYKRTFAIKNGQKSDHGIVYFGDGAWGTDPREIGRSHKSHAWYLERVAAQRHVIIATLKGRGQHFLVINEDGKIIDEYPTTSQLDNVHSNLATPWLE